MGETCLVLELLRQARASAVKEKEDAWEQAAQHIGEIEALKDELDRLRCGRHGGADIKRKQLESDVQRLAKELAAARKELRERRATNATERLLTQENTLRTFLEEEAMMAEKAGGKLRGSILKGASSPEIMAQLSSSPPPCRPAVEQFSAPLPPCS